MRHDAGRVRPGIAPAGTERPGHLDARLLGRPTFLWAGEPLALTSLKSNSMLAYLALRPGGASRDGLADLLWRPGGLGNVRQALYQLRRLPGAERWLEDGEVVRVKVESDVAVFERAVRDRDPEAALEAWRGPLLDGVRMASPAFQEWLEIERARLEMLRLDVLQQRSSQLEQAGAFVEASSYARELLELDPLNENALRVAMRLEHILGNTSAAMALYRRSRRVLEVELRSEPVEETVALATAIARGRPMPGVSALEALTDDDVRLVRALAAAGDGVDLATIARALGRDAFALAESVAALQRRRIVGDDSTVPNPLRNDVLAATPVAVRRHLHHALALALEGRDDPGAPAVLARHWLEAWEPRRAAPWFCSAAGEAARSHRDDESRLHAFSAMWTGDASVRFDAALLLEGLAERAGDTELQEAALEEAYALAWDLQDDRALANVHLRRGRRALRRRRASEAMADAQEAREIARRLGDETLEAQAVNGVGAAHFYAGDLDAAAAAFALNASATDQTERYRALNNLGAIEGVRGALQRSYRHFGEALTLARRAGEIDDVAGCLNNLAATAERMAAYDRATLHLREARDLARRSNDVGREAQMLVNLSVVYTKQGALGPAWNTVQEVLEDAHAHPPHVSGSALEQLGEIARIAGAAERAARHFEEALERFSHLGDERKAAAIRCSLALTRLQAAPEDEVARAAATIEALEAQGLAERASWFWAELALVATDPGRALAWCDRALRSGGSPHLQFVVDLARLRAGLLARPPSTGVPPGLTDALEQLEVVELPYAHALLGRAVELDGGDPARYDERAVELWHEQGRGLPAPLRESLSAQPTRVRELLRL